jgi:hypothetical protein
LCISAPGALHLRRWLQAATLIWRGMRGWPPAACASVSAMNKAYNQFRKWRVLSGESRGFYSGRSRCSDKYGRNAGTEHATYARRNGSDPYHATHSNSPNSDAMSPCRPEANRVRDNQTHVACHIDEQPS